MVCPHVMLLEVAAGMTIACLCAKVQSMAIASVPAKRV